MERIRIQAQTGPNSKKEVIRGREEFNWFEIIEVRTKRKRKNKQEERSLNKAD